jgi:hypothetical protein
MGNLPPSVSFLAAWLLLTAVLWAVREWTAARLGSPTENRLGHKSRTRSWFVQCDTLSFLPAAFCVFKLHQLSGVVYGVEFAATGEHGQTAWALLVWLVVACLNYAFFASYAAASQAYALKMNACKHWAKFSRIEQSAFVAFAILFIVTPWAMTLYLSSMLEV